MEHANKMKYTFTLRNRPFYNILNKKKDLEGRLFSDEFRKIREGDEIVFTNDEDIKEKRILHVKVLEVIKFDSFKSAFDVFDSQRAIPNYSKKECLRIYTNYYSRYKQKKYGVLIIRIKVTLIRRGI